MRVTEFKNLQDYLKEKEFEKAIKISELQINEIAFDASRDESKSVLILCSKSSIHNIKGNKDHEVIYRQHIKKWLDDIYKVAPEILNVTASCEDLKIIFDFESIFVRLL